MRTDVRQGYILISEGSSCRGNEDSDRHKNEEKGHKDSVDTSTVVLEDKTFNTRYFIIKSLNHENIQLSVEKGIWATQLMNEPILEEAFHVRLLSLCCIDALYQFCILPRSPCLAEMS